MGTHFRKWKADTAEKTIYEQKKKIARMSKINRSFLRGFRLPRLSQDGNVHFGALKKYAFNYDSSAIVSQEDILKNTGNMRYWPHTLDFPPTYACSTCATKRSFCREKENCTMNSIWVVPLHTLGVEGKEIQKTLQNMSFQNTLYFILFVRSKCVSFISQGRNRSESYCDQKLHTTP